MNDALITLLHLADSAYPTGSFAHSWGLEYAIYNGWVKDTMTLAKWCESALRGSFVPLEGRAALCAYSIAARDDFDALFVLDAEVTSLRPAHTIRATSAQMGRSFASITATSYGDSKIVKLDRLIRESNSEYTMQNPVVWGAVLSWLGIGRQEMLSSFLFGIARQWMQVAIRIIPLGQRNAHAFLASVTGIVTSLVAQEIGAGQTELQSIAPFLDIAGIGHESLSARYFIN